MTAVKERQRANLAKNLSATRELLERGNLLSHWVNLNGTGTHLWADRFDGSLDDVFDLQDNLALCVAGVVGETVHDQEGAPDVAQQTVLLNFNGLSWPHITVATLRKTGETA